MGPFWTWRWTAGPADTSDEKGEINQGEIDLIGAAQRSSAPYPFKSHLTAADHVYSHMQLNRFFHLYSCRQVVVFALGLEINKT